MRNAMQLEKWIDIQTDSKSPTDQQHRDRQTQGDFQQNNQNKVSVNILYCLRLKRGIN